MKNYYKILEVDKDASPETIEKVYKMLVKKYHPDLQNDKDKIEAEDKIKTINEAYDILSDPIKREEYNTQLTNTTISIEEYNTILNENLFLKKELNYVKDKLHEINNNNFTNTSSYSTNTENFDFNTSNYYSDYQNNNTNPISNKKFSLKNIIRLLISILLTGIIVIFLISKIPFIYNLFNSNILIFILSLLLIIFLSKK